LGHLRQQRQCVPLGLWGGPSTAARVPLPPSIGVRSQVDGRRLHLADGDEGSGSGLALAPDKESITADASPTSPFRDNVYAAWTIYGGNGFGGSTNQIVFVRSTDGGVTWSTPKGISPSDLKSDRGGAIIGVGPKGTVYVMWADKVQKTLVNRLSISYDGGKTFPKQNITVSDASSEHLFPAPFPGATFPINDFPSFSVGTNGTLAAAWTVRTGGHSVVMTTTSTNGLTWSAPVVAADVPGRSAFFAAVAVDPNGKVNVLASALDDVPDGTPPGAGVVSYGTYWTQSVDGGATFGAPLEVNKVESDPDASGYPDLAHQFIGDFIWATADAGHVYVVWSDARDGTPCAAEDAYVLGTGQAPDIITQCPVNWGNTDAYLGIVSY
jgi:hypothetical protein